MLLLLTAGRRTLAMMKPLLSSLLSIISGRVSEWPKQKQRLSLSRRLRDRNCIFSHPWLSLYQRACVKLVVNVTSNISA